MKQSAILMFEIWISLGHIQIKLSVADSLQNNFYKINLSPTVTVNVKKRNRSNEQYVPILALLLQWQALFSFNDCMNMD